MRRREVLKWTVGGAASWTLPQLWAATQGASAEDYELRRHVATKLFTAERCWVHPRAGIVPRVGEHGKPRVVMTMNTWARDGDDVFRAVFCLHTDDLGPTSRPAKRG